MDHLNYAQYFPICIFLKSQSRNHTKELRQKFAKNLKAKSSRRLYENALKLQTYYSHLFTATVHLDSNQWFKKVKEIIDEQQNEPVWISQDLENLLTTQANQDEELNLHQNNLMNQVSTDVNSQLQFNSTPNGHCLNKFGNNRYLFDDNFEFPIYTSANNPLSMSGAASSTYSLYEENNYRSSFAASDSDICSSSMANGIMKPNNNYTNDNSIYSTNFNNNINKSNYTCNGEPQFMNQNSVMIAGAVPIVISNDNNQSCSIKTQNLNRVHSDPNMIANNQDEIDNFNIHSQLNNYMNCSEIKYNQFEPNGNGIYKKNVFDDQILYTQQGLNNVDNVSIRFILFSVNY